MANRWADIKNFHGTIDYRRENDWKDESPEVIQEQQIRSWQTGTVEVRRRSAWDVGDPYGPNPAPDAYAEWRGYISRSGEFHLMNKEVWLVPGSPPSESWDREDGSENSTQRDSRNEVTLRIYPVKRTYDLIVGDMEFETTVTRSTGETFVKPFVGAHDSAPRLVNLALPSAGSALGGSITIGRSGDAVYGGQKTLNWNLQPGAEKKLAANPGGPYSVERGKVLRLNGSRSTGDIKTAKWTFAPNASSNLPASTQLNLDSRKEGLKTTITPLCPLTATLTVSDGFSEDTKSVEISVKPREWKTPISYKSNWAFEPPWPPPRMRWINEEEGLAEIDSENGGNLCAGCHRNVEQTIGVMHPHGLRDKNTWLDYGYALGQVEDPSGPFHGWFYVSASDLVVAREGVFNKHIRKESKPVDGAIENFYNANANRGVKIGTYLKALEKHEGWGSRGKPRSGHTQIMKETLEEKDPRKEIERIFGPDRAALREEADKAIKAVDLQLARDSKDDPKLTGNWDGPYYVWNLDSKEWVETPPYQF